MVTPIVKKPLPPQGRGIYLLPNLFTVTALFAGFYAVIIAMQGRFDNSAIAIFVAMIMDGLDGRVARMTHTQTAFGAQFDSLSDMISFGIAPALVVFCWTLNELGNYGWLAAFIYAVATALRLARFNIQLGKVDKHYFQGLPSPSAAAIVASMVWIGHDFHLKGIVIQIIAAFITVAVGLLMISNAPYRSFKDFNARGKVPFIVMVIIVLVYVLISIEPPVILFVIFSVYALSGPVTWMWRWRKTLREKKILPPGV